MSPALNKRWSKGKIFDNPTPGQNTLISVSDGCSLAVVRGGTAELGEKGDLNNRDGRHCIPRLRFNADTTLPLRILPIPFLSCNRFIMRLSFNLNSGIVSTSSEKIFSSDTI